MFLLTKNKLMEEGKCWYEDKYGNSVFVKKSDLSITLKLRFVDKQMKALPLKIDFPMTTSDMWLSLTPESRQYFNQGGNRLIPNHEAIDGFTELIHHWIDIMYDILELQTVIRTDPNGQRCDELKKNIKSHIELAPMIEIITQN